MTTTDTRHRPPVALRLEAAMKDKGFGQRQLSRESGVAQSGISAILAGKQETVEVATLARLAGALGIPTRRLLGDDDPMPSVPALPSGAWSGAIHHDYLPLAKLMPSANNPRRTFETEPIEELAASIAAQGVLQNLVVRRLAQLEITGEQYEVIAGGRRYRALRLLEARGQWDGAAANIPVRIVQVDDVDALAIALLENLQRQDVPPLEEGRAFAQLQELDPVRFSTARLAERVHMKIRYVQTRIALATKLVPEAQQALEGGAINIDRARALLAADAKEQRKLVKRMAKEPHALRTGEEVRRAISGSWVPVGAAAFDVESSGLAVAEDPDSGARYFTDRDAFMRAQKAEAERRAEELRRNWSWVEVETYFYKGNYADERSDDPETAGAVVCVDWTGALTVHEGLIRHPDHVEDPAESAARDAEFDRQRRERAATEKFGGQLRNAMATSPKLAKRLLALALICAPDVSPIDIIDESGEAAFRRAVGSKPFGELAAPDDPDEDGWQGAVLRGDADPREAFAVLQRMREADVDRLLAGAVADMLCVGMRFGAVLALHAQLAEMLGVKVPKHIRQTVKEAAAQRSAPARAADDAEDVAA